MDWAIIDVGLGQTGKYRDTLTVVLNAIYKDGNWRFRWLKGKSTTDFLGACKLYEEAYFIDAVETRPDLWDELRLTARDVYDNNVSNIDSLLDYSIQEADSAHIQDIAVRNVFDKLGWVFEGDEDVQVRSNSAHEFGKQLSPMYVKFHKPSLILQPSLEYGVKGSVEEWYQTNKVFQVKKGLERIGFSPKEFLSTLKRAEKFLSMLNED